MDFSLTFKPGQVESIVKQAKRSGQQIPDRILNAPELPLNLEFFYKAFWALNTCRSFGMGEGPIPFTAILSYANHYECGEELTDDLVDIIMQMDTVYLKFVARQNASKK